MNRTYSPAAVLSHLGIRPASARSAGGRAAKYHGQELESDVMAAVCVYREIALIRVPDGAKRIGGGKMVPVRSPFDFAGVVRETGRGIFFDAKCVGSGASLCMREDKVKAHQVGYLCGLGRAGAIAGLLVRCEPRGDYRWLPWTAIEQVTPVRWDDARWIVLGEIRGGLRFTRLLSA